MTTKTTMIETWNDEVGSTAYLRIQGTRSCTDHQRNVTANNHLIRGYCKVSDGINTRLKVSILFYIYIKIDDSNQ